MRISSRAVATAIVVRDLRKTYDGVEEVYKRTCAALSGLAKK